MLRISLLGLVLLFLSSSNMCWAQALEWSNGLVWYQIFPERFRNGDLTNEPNKELAKGPEGWALSSWTSDWYSRAHWEKQATFDFYEIVRERQLMHFR